MSIYRPDGETPWNMPPETFWNIKDGATVGRAQWVIDNRPGVSLDDLSYYLALHENEIAQLDLGARQTNSEEQAK